MGYLREEKTMFVQWWQRCNEEQDCGCAGVRTQGPSQEMKRQAGLLLVLWSRGVCDVVTVEKRYCMKAKRSMHCCCSDRNRDLHYLKYLIASTATFNKHKESMSCWDTHTGRRDGGGGEYRQENAESAALACTEYLQGQQSEYTRHSPWPREAVQTLNTKCFSQAIPLRLNLSLYSFQFCFCSFW